MVDIAAARQSYKRYEIHGVGLVAVVFNPTDGFTKVSGNGSLSVLISSGCAGTPLSQWIKRAVVQPTNSGKVAGV